MGSVAVALAIVWNSARKFTILEADNKTGKEQHNKDIDNLENSIQEMKEQRSQLVLEYSQKISQVEKDLLARIQEAKLERREEIQSTLIKTKDQFSDQLKQIEELRRELKDIATTVVKANTKVDYIEKQLDNLEECDRDTKKSVHARMDRLEDRIEYLIRQAK